MRKLDLKKIVEAMKPVKDVKKPVPPKVVPSGPRERDMRQEARELGSHGAQEYFGESNQ